MTPIFKLTDNHLNMTPQERQNVRKAAELLSRTTSIALQRYYPEDSDAKELASFIEKGDLWFNIANSYSPKAKLDFKKSCNGNENQTGALKDMFDLMLNMRAIGKKGMQVFQKSVLMHISSLQLLFGDMKRKYGYRVELGKTHKKAELGPDDSNKFRTQFRRVGSIRQAGTARNRPESSGIVGIVGIVRSRRNFPESSGIDGNRSESLGIARNCPESPGIARNCPESPGITRNRPESSVSVGIPFHFMSFFQCIS